MLFPFRTILQRIRCESDFSIIIAAPVTSDDVRLIFTYLFCHISTKDMHKTEAQLTQTQNA